MQAKTKSIAQMAGAAIAADERYSALCDADASGIAIDRQGAHYKTAMAALAALPARSVSDIQDKGAALATAVLVHPDKPASVEGDYGLAASIVQDLRYLSGLNPPAVWPRGMSTRVAAAYLGVSVSVIRAARDFPQPVYITPARRMYLREDVDAWLDRQAGRPVEADDAAAGAAAWMAA